MKPVLSRKQEAILFLFTLSSLNARQSSSIQTTIPVQRSSLKVHAVTPVSESTSSIEDRTRSNAARLQEFRAQKGASNYLQC